MSFKTEMNKESNSLVQICFAMTANDLTQSSELVMLKTDVLKLKTDVAEALSARLDKKKEEKVQVLQVLQ